MWNTLDCTFSLFYITTAAHAVFSPDAMETLCQCSMKMHTAVHINFAFKLKHLAGIAATTMESWWPSSCFGWTFFPRTISKHMQIEVFYEVELQLAEVKGCALAD